MWLARLFSIRALRNPTRIMYIFFGLQIRKTKSGQIEALRTRIQVRPSEIRNCKGTQYTLDKQNCLCIIGFYYSSLQLLYVA